jgi:hypothetical protein
LTVFCKKALAQSALQTISQVQELEDIWGFYKNPALYGILTNGLEWFIVAHVAGKWRRSSVINTARVNIAGALVVDTEGISFLAKAIQKVLLNAIEWSRRMQSTKTCENFGDANDSNNYSNHTGGNKKTDANNDENDGDADNGLANLSFTSNATNENSYGTKFGKRKAFEDVTLTVQSVELLARQNRTASHRRMLALYD